MQFHATVPSNPLYFVHITQPDNKLAISGKMHDGSHGSVNSTSLDRVVPLVDNSWIFRNVPLDPELPSTLNCGPTET